MTLKVIKIATLLLKNKGLRKKIGIIIGIIVSPFILLIALLTSSADAAVQHNHAVVQTVFNQAEIPSTVPEDFRLHILTMQDEFKQLDLVITSVQDKIETGSLDPMQVKSLFFSVYFGRGNVELSSEQRKDYVNCFVHYETIVIPPSESDKEKASEDVVTDDSEIENDSNDDDPSEEVVSKEIAVVIEDLNLIKERISLTLSEDITNEQNKNYEQIYKLVNPGANASTSGDGDTMQNLLKEAIHASENKPYVGGTPSSPFDDDWRDKITSEFGRRAEITLPDGTTTNEEHTGMDLGKGTPLGTTILSVNDGEVVYVRNHKVGLGLHLAVDHGGGILTVYGHTSRIVVKEGEKVKKGQKIAEVGSTGYSTGPHLHLEYWLHGKVLDPREYLE